MFRKNKNNKHKYKEKNQLQGGILIKLGVILFIFYIIGSSYIQDQANLRALQKSTPLEVKSCPEVDPIEKEKTPPQEPVEHVRITDITIGMGIPISCGEEVLVHYTVMLPDGSIVKDTRGRDPAIFIIGSNGTIEGIAMALDGMRKGGKRQVIAPAHMLYEGISGIAAQDDFGLNIEVVDIIGRKETPKNSFPLKYFDEIIGNGNLVKCGDEVEAHYRAFSPDGVLIFDKITTFILGDKDTPSLINSGLNGMRIGGKRLLVAPPHLLPLSRGSEKLPWPEEKILHLEVTL